jgi:hypothetical protein
MQVSILSAYRQLLDVYACSPPKLLKKRYVVQDTDAMRGTDLFDLFSLKGRVTRAKHLRLAGNRRL